MKCFACGQEHGALFPVNDIPMEDDGDRQCKAKLVGFACARTVGHDGDHVAHVGKFIAACRWRDEVPSSWMAE